MAAISARLRRWFVHGAVLSIPLVVTLLLIIVVLEFIVGVLSPVIDGVAYVWPNEPSMAVIQGTTLVLLVLFFLLIGIVAEYTPGEHISGTINRLMETVPGISTIYTTLRRTGNVLVEDDTAQFQDVKLVEFPHDGAYMLGFLTADTAPEIEEGAGVEEMQTIMVPLGPNPTTNGFVMHMPVEHVHDVDMSVEDAVQSIATLGIASSEVDGEEEVEEEA